MLPKRHDPSLTRVKPIIKIAFDPRKSPHYNVIGILDGFDKIEIYSSKTGSWSVCRIPNISRIYFQWGINWNNAIHWLDNEKGPLHFILDILNEHPIITKIQLPVTVDKRMPWDRKLFESRGCLLLLGVDYKYSQQFNIYEMSNVSSESEERERSCVYRGWCAIASWRSFRAFALPVGGWVSAGWTALRGGLGGGVLCWLGEEWCGP
ncbi:hypothetical protein Tco_0150417 [Tanacetum coccineum]